MMFRAGVPNPIATSDGQAFGLIAQGDAAWLSTDVVALTGRQPRSLHPFIADNVKAST